MDEYADMVQPGKIDDSILPEMRERVPVSNKQLFCGMAWRKFIVHYSCQGYIMLSVKQRFQTEPLFLFTIYGVRSGFDLPRNEGNQQQDGGAADAITEGQRKSLR